MASSESRETRSKRPWALTFFGLLAAGGLVAMPFLAGEVDGEKLPDMMRFAGRFHPVLLHLPIGVFTLILLQELGAIFFRRGGDLRQTTAFPMFFGAASAIVAVVAGFLLYHGGGYEGSELAERHLWLGLGFAVAAVITFIVKAWTVARAGNPAFYRLLLFASVGVMGFASHDGASLTHGSGYLTDYAPDPLRKLLGKEPRNIKETPKTLEDRLAYADVVGPILERRCVECHREEKTKGRFRMDTFDLLVKGGKEGPGIKPGSSAESNIVYRIELPIDDEDHMPPDGKKEMEPHELVVLKWWIDKGADPLATIGELEPDDVVRSALALLEPEAPEMEKAVETAPAAGPEDSLKETVAGLAKEFPGAIQFESQNSPLLSFTAVSLRANMDDELFNKLAPVIPHLSTADLSATKVTDRSVALLEDAANLKLIRLAETGITDAAIDSLLKIPSLESVNLYGTKVTDAGVAKLAGLPNLKRLYLWQTEVSDGAIAELQKKLPGLEIVKGI